MNKRSIILCGVIGGSVLAAAGRFLIPGHELSLAGTYEALAHIWVGVLITLGWVKGTTDVRLESRVALSAITVLEIVMFFLRR